MKTRYFAFAAALGMLASCAKQEIEQTPVSPLDFWTADVTLSKEDGTKLNLNGVDFNWDAGDDVAVCQYNQKGTSVTTANSFSVLSYSGSDCTFTGTMKVPSYGNSFYVIAPASAVTSCNPGSTVVNLTIPSVQSGLADDMEKNTILYGSGALKIESCKAVGKAAGETPVNGDMLESIQFSYSSLKVVSPIVKIKVPSSLNITEIGVTAKAKDGSDVYLSGAGVFKINNRYVNTAPDTKHITITRGGSTIEDTVCFAIFPDSIKVENVFKSRAAALTFTFRNNAGEMAFFTGNIDKDNLLSGGKVYFLGEVPTTLSFVKPTANKPTSFGYTDVKAGATGDAGANTVTETEYSGRIYGNVAVEEGTKAQWTYGIQYSLDGGTNWLYAGDIVEYSDVADAGVETIKFYSVVSNMPLTSTVKYRTVIAPAAGSAASVGVYSPEYEITGVASDYIVKYNVSYGSNTFDKTVKTSSTEALATPYSNEAFYYKQDGSQFIFDGPVWTASNGLSFNSSSKLSIPSYPGLTLKQAIMYIGNTDKRAYIKNSSATSLCTLTSVSSEGANNKITKRYYRGTVKDATENQDLYVASNVSGDKNTPLRYIILCFEATGTPYIVKGIEKPVFNGNEAIAGFEIQGGTAADYTYGIEWTEDSGATWTKVPGSGAVLNDGKYSFTITGIIKNKQYYRTYIYPNAGTEAQNAHKSEMVEYFTGKVITIDFGAGCPLSKFGTDPTPGAYVDTTTSIQPQLYYNSRTGYDFPTAKQVCGQKTNKDASPNVSNDGGACWTSYTSGGKTTTQWWTNYPMTKFNLSAGGTTYVIRVGTQMSNRDAYLYYDASSKALVSNKLVFSFPVISGYKLTNVSYKKASGTSYTAYIKTVKYDDVNKTTTTSSRKTITATGEDIVVDLSSETSATDATEYFLQSNNNPQMYSITLTYTAVE